MTEIKIEVSTEKAKKKIKNYRKKDRSQHWKRKEKDKK